MAGAEAGPAVSEWLLCEEVMVLWHKTGKGVLVLARQ